MTTLPHILLLITDQFRYDVASPVITPNLYQHQQSNGTTTFTHAYSSTPTCTPARAGLLTGKSPWAHGMLSYGQYTDCTEYPTTLPRVLDELRNYKTAAIGKNHFGPKKHIQGYQDETIYDGLSYEQGDDYDHWFNETMPNMDPKATCQLEWNDWKACPYYYEEYVHPSSWTTRTALDYMEDYFDEDHNSDQPLFLKVSYHRPHSPYDPPRRLLDQYLDGGSKSHVPQLDRFVNDSSWDRKFKDIPMGHDAWAGDPGAAAARHSRAGYLANVDFVDEGVGQLLDYLSSHDLLDQFLIVWTSDHGDQNGDHYLWRKGYPWEGTAHINFVIKLPNSDAPPQISDALVENRDVAPTIYDILGVLENVQQRDPFMDGSSLLPILTGRSSQVREWLDLEHGTVYNETIHWNALVGYLTHSYCDYWKYIFNAFEGSEQLFCLSKDPNETYDLVSLYIEVLAAWRQRMSEQFQTEGRGKNWVQDGALQVRKKSTLYGPNFPCKGQRDIPYLEMSAF
jgi:arylsulfatase